MASGIISLKNLGYLYLAFAHLTDEVLEESEIDSIKERLHRRAPEMSDLDLTKLMANIELWYNNSSENRQDVIRMLVGEIHFEVEDESVKRSIIDDLESIAGADHTISANEETFIKNLSSAWGLN